MLFICNNLYFQDKKSLEICYVAFSRTELTPNKALSLTGKNVWHIYMVAISILKVKVNCIFSLHLFEVSLHFF